MAKKEIFNGLDIDQFSDDCTYLANRTTEVLMFIPRTDKILKKAEKKGWNEDETVRVLAKNYQDLERFCMGSHIAFSTCLALGAASVDISFLQASLFVLAGADLLISSLYTMKKTDKHRQRAKKQAALIFPK